MILKHLQSIIISSTNFEMYTNSDWVYGRQKLLKFRITKGGSNIFLSNKSQWTIASNNMNITFVLMVQGIARDR